MKFFLLCFGYTISLLIFQSGFLLKRKELHMRSSCRDARVGGSGCWMSQRYNRVILVIIDALRYDFIAPAPHGVESPYHGQMRFASSLSSSSLLTSIIADPPTTTLQRLKAITTGTLPTFIDASDNFSPDAQIHEDNILDQLLERHKNATLLGDDTWVSLYPRRFHREFSMPSFDVHDLHTVDNEIIARLPDELARNDSQLLIAHFLGVDHCGHKFGPDHPEMSNKLRQMDRTVQSIVEAMRADDLLVVMGDHGMTQSGDHGGDADLEVTAGLLVHSPSERFRSPAAPLRQIDVVPSIALLLGLPIPFSNLGTAIPELFPDESTRRAALQLNYEQVVRFARTYASSNPVQLGDVALHTEGEEDEGEQRRTLKRVQSSLRAAWTQFDVTLMLVGLASIAECLLYNLSDEPCSLAQWVIRSGTLLLQFSTYFGGSANMSVPLLFSVLSILVVFHLAGIAREALSSHTIRPKKVLGLLFCALPTLCFFSNSFIVREAEALRFLLQTLIALSLGIHVMGWEKKLGGGRLWSKSLRTLVSSEEFWLPVLTIALLRLEPLFHRCREEEESVCEQYLPTALSASLSPDARVWRFALGVVSALGLHWLFGKGLWRERGAVSSTAPSPSAVSRLSRALSLPSLLAVFLNWALDLLPYTVTSIKTAQLGSAWIVYTLFGIVVLMNVIGGGTAGSLCHRQDLLHSALPIVLLLLGDGLAPAVTVFTIVALLLPRVVEKELQPAADGLLIPLGFYFFGHSPTLTAIPWTAAFVGVPGNLGLRVVPAVLVLSHLFAASLIVVLRLSLQGSAEAILPSLLATSASRAAAASAAAAILRRHLMVWKIFAPRFIFEAVGFLYLIFGMSLCILIRKRFLR